MVSSFRDALFARTRNPEVAYRLWNPGSTPRTALRADPTASPRNDMRDGGHAAGRVRGRPLCPPYELRTSREAASFPVRPRLVSSHLFRRAYLPPRGGKSVRKDDRMR